ncbi:MAG: hypothetical protein FJ150_08525 [Euryarchaeota archaeon]|nr:hypothetical protein [Euryarchaeota archaeon]
MGKITIKGKEWDEDELLAEISKADDYTQKTQKLAEERQVIDSEKLRLKDLMDLDEYRRAHPDFDANLRKFVTSDVEKRYGNKSQPGQNFTNVSPSDYSAGSPSDEGYEDEPKYITEKDLKTYLDDVEKRVEAKNEAKSKEKEVNSEIGRQYNFLQAKKYSKDEINVIMGFAQQNGMWPINAAETLAFRKVVPDRFHEPDPQIVDPKDVKILKGDSSSGFELPDPEKDLIAYGNDPAEYMRANIDKFVKKE